MTGDEPLEPSASHVTALGGQAGLLRFRVDVDGPAGQQTVHVAVDDRLGGVEARGAAVARALAVYREEHMSVLHAREVARRRATMMR